MIINFDITNILKIKFSAGIYLLKDNNRSTRKNIWNLLKLAIQQHNDFIGGVLVFLFLTLNRFPKLFQPVNAG